MRYSDSDAYIIERGGRRSSGGRRRGGGAGRAAGVLIAVLLILTAVICLLVVFLPRIGNNNTAVNSSAVGGNTYFFLCTAETEDRMQSISQAQDAMARGGAGYVFNNGKYRVVAAVYNREADVKTLVTVNADSFYFSLSLPARNYTSGDKAVVEYLTGDWFDTVSASATELDRGNITESAAEYAVQSVCSRLRDLALKSDSEKLKNAISACAYSPPASQTVLSYIRYINVLYIINACAALE